ncbi:MAG: tetratricopeptide repeat protein [Pseudomonadota bacterium]
MTKPATSISTAIKSALALGLIMAMPLSAPLHAAGSSSGPSRSAPQYDAAAEYQKGLAALEAEDYREAEKALKRVIRVSPEDANAQYMLGVTYMRSGDFKKALKRLEKAIRYAPGMIIAHRDLGITYVRLDKNGDAEATLDRLNALKADCAGSCSDAAALDEAIAAIKGAMSGAAVSRYGPDVTQLADAASGDALYSAAIGLINQQRYAEALQALEQAALAFGPHPDIVTYQGFANRKLKRLAAAEYHYNRALALAPDHRGAWEYYGELKLERGDMAGAKQHLAKLEDLCSFGCYEADELRRWIVEVEARSSAS